MTRRDIIKSAAIGVGTATLASACTVKTANAMGKEDNTLKGNINHSVCKWCYGSIPLEQLCEEGKDIGLQSIELTVPEEWKTLQRYGLTCAVGTHGKASLTKGFNHKEYHAALQPIYLDLIDKAADSGVPNVIVFSGNRTGISETAGLENCAAGLDAVVKHAEKKGVTMVMELLNSKVDHQDYQCDNTPWGMQLVDKIGSTNFKLLYDIYHMQIMEGDIIATIRAAKDYIAHYHTGGVPGRNEINASQELNYAAIMKAIQATGFDGFVAQEFIPTYSDKISALKEGILICDV